MTDQIQCYINATPITGRVQIERRGATRIAAFGCGLNHYINSVSKRKFSLFLNITIPYMPITTDGKEPNFLYFLKDIEAVTGKATRVLRSALKKSTGKIRYVLTDNMDEAIAKVSDNGKFRYSLRQLFYALRPFVLENPELGELDYGYFGRVIGEYEADYGELKGMYRDPRGTLYHPHTHKTIPIGTISVEQYKRPDWTFNKILYIEKEGLFEVLKQVGFPEKYDCALLSSKGYASRAVRDVIDLLGDTSEEIKFFCIHDSDGPGTMIYQSLQEGTVARAKRRVKIINLGLDPWDAREMKLQVETFAERKQKVPVAKYIEYHDRDHDLDDDMSGWKWVDWLQTNRVELNAMTSPQFVEWLEEKMKEHNIGKVVPPEGVLKSHLRERTRDIVRSKVTERILRDARFEDEVATEMRRLQAQVDELDVCETVESGLRSTPRQMWTSPIESAANSIAESV